MAVTPDNMEVTLVLPGVMTIEREAFRPFVQQAVKQGERLPALERLLSRGRYYCRPELSFERLLFKLFAVNLVDDQDVPVGALNWLLYDGEASGQWMMRADPVNVQPNRGHLIMMGNDELVIRDDEAQRLVKDINDTYPDTDWQLHALSPLHWIIQSPRPLDLKTHPLTTVLGQDISQYLPYGKDSAPWHGVMNELQMLLHSHPVNREREARGLPIINSVWLWGGGSLPAVENDKDDVQWAQCWSNNPVAQGLAKLKKLPRVDLPVDGDTWLKQAITRGNHLLVMDNLNIPVSVLEPYSWWQDLVQINHRWLQPLLDALQRGEIAQLTLETGVGSRYELTPSLAKRWWQRVRPLNNI